MDSVRKAAKVGRITASPRKSLEALLELQRVANMNETQNVLGFSTSDWYD
jgi:hypothetical protein